jgi:hypothetical protein
MKKIFFYLLIAIFVVPISCTKDFESINTDPTGSSPASFDANYFLSNSQQQYKESIAGYNGPILFQSGWVQILSSTSSGGVNYYSNMDKYVASSNTNNYANSSWSSCYRSAGLASEIVKILGDDAAKSNVVSAGIIMKVLSLHYATDTYGDIPYSEALQGTSGVSLPMYDKQQAVYTGLLTDLEGALTKLDPAKVKPSADLFSTGGDIAKWKRFGYSLMLRIAMRLTKVDAAAAKSWAEKAYAGGTMSSVDDDVYMKGSVSTGYSNPNSRALITAGDYYQVRWSKTLMDYLMSTNDPRISAIAEVPQAGLAANNNNALSGDNTAGIQLGMPNGYDLNGGATDITTAPGFPGGTGAGADATPLGKYSRPRTSVYTDLNTPVSIITYAESELLLAEAAARGWSVGASASVHYSNGVSAGIQALAHISANATVSAATANMYAAANPLNTSSLNASLKMINEQYWATTGVLLNFSEAWSNWRRSGFPVLSPVVFTGNFSGGVIPRRQIYPTGEPGLNGANYLIGVAGLSAGDTWASRVWWDK